MILSVDCSQPNNHESFESLIIALVEVSFKKTPIVTCIVLILVLILICLLFRGGIVQISNLNTIPIKEYFRRLRKNAWISTLPAGRPADESMKLPIQFKMLLRALKKGTRMGVTIECSRPGAAAEWGRLLCFEIRKMRFAHYLGWINYGPQDNGEFCIDRSLEDQCSSETGITFSKQKNYFYNERIHTILFINVEKISDQGCEQLIQLTGYPGLSIILLSKEPIRGFPSVYNDCEVELSENAQLV